MMTQDTLSQKELDSAAILPTPKRIWEIDAVRGFCVLLMIMDHTFANALMYGKKWYGFFLQSEEAMAGFARAARWYWSSTPRDIIHPIIVFLFIFLCGLSCGFSKNNLKRGLLLSVIAIFITLITVNFNGGVSSIRFGIIHLLSFSIIVWAIISYLCKQDKRLKLICGISLSLVVFLLWIILISNPTLNDKLANKMFFMTESVFSSSQSPADFFAIIPWSGILYLGAGLSAYIYPDKKTLCPKLDKAWHRPLCFIGRHALIIYVAHTFVIMLIFELIGYSIFGNWTFI